MKSYFSFLTLFIFIIVYNSLISNDQIWEWQHPLPSGNNLYGVSFPSSEVGYITGDAGTIIKYESQKFTLKPKIGNILLKGCYFFDENNGFVVGYDNNNGYISKTENGANSWDIYKIEGNKGVSLSKIQFLNEDFGIVTGWGGNIFRTINRGKSWEELKNITDRPMEGFQAVNDSLYFACLRSGEILRTKDSAKTWKNVFNNQNCDFMCIYFINNKIGWASGVHGLIMKTTDGGDSWNKMNTNGWQNSFFNEIYFTDENSGMAIGTDGIAIFSQDGGITWNNSQNSCSTTINGIDFKGNKGWAVGNYGTINYSKDFTLGFSKVNVPDFTISFREVNFYDDNFGFVFGDLGHIWKTTNGGKLWSKKEAFLWGDIQDSWIKNKDTIFFIADGATIGRSTDGGETWNKMSLEDGQHQTERLKCIFFSSKTTGWAVGVNGLILKSIDEGNNWKVMPKIDDLELKCVVFSDSLNGIICNIIGSYYETSDGGENWHLRNEFDQQEIRKLQFLNSHDGWMVTNYNIYSTNDAGKNWILKRAIDDNNNDFVSCHFLDKNNGWVIANYYPSILKTTDGGETWKNYNIPEEIFLTGIFFSSENIGWLIGSGGVIMNTTKGGILDVKDKPVYNENDSFIISPNPANDILTIKSDKIGINFYSIDLYDISGQKLFNIDSGINSNLEFNKNYRLPVLSVGTYYIRIIYNNIVCFKPVIIIK